MTGGNGKAPVSRKMLPHVPSRDKTRGNERLPATRGQQRRALFSVQELETSPFLSGETPDTTHPHSIGWSSKVMVIYQGAARRNKQHRDNVCQHHHGSPWTDASCCIHGEWRQASTMMPGTSEHSEDMVPHQDPLSSAQLPQHPGGKILLS